MTDTTERKYGSKAARIVSIVLFSVFESAVLIFIGLLLLVGLLSNDVQSPLGPEGVIFALFIAFVPLPELFCTMMYFFSNKPKKIWKTVLAILMIVSVLSFIMGCVWIIASQPDSSVAPGIIGALASVTCAVLPIIWFIGAMIGKAKKKKENI